MLELCVKHRRVKPDAGPRSGYGATWSIMLLTKSSGPTEAVLPRQGDIGARSNVSTRWLSLEIDRLALEHLIRHLFIGRNIAISN